MRDESLQSDELQEPEVIAAEILERLQVATEMEALMVLEGEEAAEVVSTSVGLPRSESRVKLKSSLNVFMAGGRRDDDRRNTG